MIFQLHWQNRINTTETVFIAQGSTEEIGEDSVVQWIKQQLATTQVERPDGFDPVVVWGDHPAMILSLQDGEGM